MSYFTAMTSTRPTKKAKQHHVDFGKKTVNSVSGSSTDEQINAEQQEGEQVDTVDSVIVSSLNQQDKSTLITLPNEVKLMIIQKLDIIDSTCLGLASKSFYPLHKAVHGFVPLLAKRLYWVVSRKNEHSPKIRYCKSWYLTTFIKEWMGSRGLELCVDGKKKRYVLVEQHAERWCCVRKKICLRGKRSTLPQDRAYFLELRSKMEMAMVQPRS